MRMRARPSTALEQVYTVDNPVVAKTWPPLEDVGGTMSPVRCRELMHHLQELEITRMQKLRSFIMPKINVGDLIEVKYELSRSQQTFAVFQGYCVEVRNRRLNSSFILKTTYDGIGVEQLIPRYSPRLLDVRVVKPLDPPAPRPDRRPITKNYKYKWHNYVRNRFSEGSEVRWRNMVQKYGVMSLEPRLRWELAKLRRRMNMRRVEAGLPPYIFPGPYPITRRQTREVKAELHRRMMLYAWDDRRVRSTKLKRMRARQKWGVYRIDKPPQRTAIGALPSYHPLVDGNLPK
jgi:ribosomal protein L19